MSIALIHVTRVGATGKGPEGLCRCEVMVGVIDVGLCSITVIGVSVDVGVCVVGFSCRFGVGVGMDVMSLVGLASVCSVSVSMWMRVV